MDYFQKGKYTFRAKNEKGASVPIDLSTVEMVREEDNTVLYCPEIAVMLKTKNRIIDRFSIFVRGSALDNTISMLEYALTNIPHVFKEEDGVKYLLEMKDTSFTGHRFYYITEHGSFVVTFALTMWNDLMDYGIDADYCRLAIKIKVAEVEHSTEGNWATLPRTTIFKVYILNILQLFLFLKSHELGQEIIPKLWDRRDRIESGSRFEGFYL